MANIPWRITIDTNPDLCNLNCIMCDTHSIYNKEHRKKRQILPLEDLQNILKQAVSLGVKEIIPSTMGEPLLYPHFSGFVEQLKGTKTLLNLTTNGTFPKKGAESWAKELLPITSDTKISINSISKLINESIMIKADTDASLKNIQTYLKVRDEIRADKNIHTPTVSLQVTFMHKNLNGIISIIKFAINNNIDRIKGHHLWVTYPELKNENLRNKESHEMWNNFINKISKYRKLIKLENFEKINEEQNLSEDYYCPFIGKELWIDSYGNYNVCCAPSEKRKEFGYFGNINDISIDKIFSTEVYQNFQNNYNKNATCQNCLLRKRR